MTAKTIPAPGEVYLGGSPHPLKVMKATYGHDSATLDGYIASSIGTTVRTLFNIPAGCLVEQIVMYVSNGFNSSKISVGDTDNTSGWFNTASTAYKATPNTRNTRSAADPVSVYKTGKYYAAAGHIKVLNTTKLTTGTLTLYLYYTMAPNQ